MDYLLKDSQVHQIQMANGVKPSGKYIMYGKTMPSSSIALTNATVNKVLERSHGKHGPCLHIHFTSATSYQQMHTKIKVRRT